MALQLASTKIYVQLMIVDDTGQVERFLTAANVLLGVAVGVVHFAADLINAIDFVHKTNVIMFKSILFGLGVTV